MTQHSLTTRLDHYINTMLPETHGHQRKAFRDFVAALLVVRTCCQATLARSFPNFEAASRRLTRWLHNPRLEPQAQARAHAQAVGAQLPLAGPVRIALDWTTEDQQHLLVASLLIGRRAVPLYWEAYTTAELKGAQRALGRGLCRTTLWRKCWALRPRAAAGDRGPGLLYGQVACLLDRWACLRVASARQCDRLSGPAVEQAEKSCRCGAPRGGGPWAALGHAHAAPAAMGGADPGTNKKGRWEYWHLASNRPLTAFTMAQEYARRFGCEEGFRDAKRELGFAQARIAEIEAWARMFALVAAALLILTQLGTHLLRHPQRSAGCARSARVAGRARS